MKKLTNLGTFILSLILLVPINYARSPKEFSRDSLNEYKGISDIISNIDKTTINLVDLKSIELIKSMEGFSSTPYNCPSGKSTIGYGFRYSNYSSMSKKVGDSILKSIYLDTKLKVISSLGNTELNSYQISALTSFTFNVGLTAFKRSTLLKIIKKGDTSNVNNEFNKWVHVKSRGKKVVLKGLVKRRIKEFNLWKGTEGTLQGGVDLKGN